MTAALAERADPRAARRAELWDRRDAIERRHAADRDELIKIRAELNALAEED